MAGKKLKAKKASPVSEMKVSEPKKEEVFEDVVEKEVEPVVEEPIEEPVPEPVLKKVEPVVVVPPKEVSKLRAAMPSKVVMNMETTKALKTTVKFCEGKWWTLVTGKNVTGTISQIAYLRSHGWVA